MLDIAYSHAGAEEAKRKMKYILIMLLVATMSGCVNWYQHRDGSWDNKDEDGYIHKVHFP